MAMTKRHIVPPATAEEISRAVGVTAEDIKVVNRVLRELGLINEDTCLHEDVPPAHTESEDSPKPDTN